MFGMFKKLLFLTFMFVSFSAISSEKTVDFVAGTTKVTSSEVLSLVDAIPNLVIIDSRKTEDRKVAGWIPGAKFLPNTETDANSLKKYLASKETPVVFYCNGPKCGRSADAATKAVQAGYTKIYWFYGGWEEWVSAGLPAEY